MVLTAEKLNMAAKNLRSKFGGSQLILNISGRIIRFFHILEEEK